MPDETLKIQMQGVLPEKTIREEQGLWRITLEQDDERDADILTQWMKMGAVICDFHRSRVPLERVFMEVTRHDA